MKQSRFIDEKIVGFLRQADAGLAVKELCRTNGFSDATFYKWRAKFGGMQGGEATRLRDIESENTKLKKLLAEAHLHIEALKVGSCAAKPRRCSPRCSRRCAPFGRHALPIRRHDCVGLENFGVFS
jgi:putative transposase